MCMMSLLTSQLRIQLNFEQNITTSSKILHHRLGKKELPERKIGEKKAKQAHPYQPAKNKVKQSRCDLCMLYAQYTYVCICIMYIYMCVCMHVCVFACVHVNCKEHYSLDIRTYTKTQQSMYTYAAANGSFNSLCTCLLQLVSNACHHVYAMVLVDVDKLFPHCM